MRKRGLMGVKKPLRGKESRRLAVVRERRMEEERESLRDERKRLGDGQGGVRKGGVGGKKSLSGTKKVGSATDPRSALRA